MSWLSQTLLKWRLLVILSTIQAKCRQWSHTTCKGDLPTIWKITKRYLFQQNVRDWDIDIIWTLWNAVFWELTSGRIMTNIRRGESIAMFTKSTVYSTLREGSCPQIVINHLFRILSRPIYRPGRSSRSMRWTWHYGTRAPCRCWASIPCILSPVSSTSHNMSKTLTSKVDAAIMVGVKGLQLFPGEICAAGGVDMGKGVLKGHTACCC